MRKLTTLIFLTLICVSAIGQVIFKNTGASKISVAICYNDNASGWTSKGWYVIEPNNEKMVYNYNALTNANFYYCATIENCDKGYFGENALYVNTKENFAIPNVGKQASYVSEFIKQYKFRHISLKGRSSYIVELQPTNLTCNGKRNGKWRLALDRDGDYAEKKEDQVYYREITFDYGRPLGWCKDFYNDGRKKAEFKLINDDPVVYVGRCIWYTQEGNIEKETIIKTVFRLML